MASVGSRMTGSLTRSTLTFLRPFQTTAFIDSAYPVPAPWIARIRRMVSQEPPRMDYDFPLELDLRRQRKSAPDEEQDATAMFGMLSSSHRHLGRYQQLCAVQADRCVP